MLIILIFLLHRNGGWASRGVASVDDKEGPAQSPGALLHIRLKYPLASDCRYCFALAGSYLIAAICAWARRATTWQTLLPIIWALAVVNRLGPARATPQMGARICQMACACVLVMGDSTDNCCRIVMNLLGSNFTSAGLPFYACELCSKPQTKIVRYFPKGTAIVNAGFVVKSCTGRTSLPCTGPPVLGCGGLSPARLPASPAIAFSIIQHLF